MYLGGGGGLNFGVIIYPISFGGVEDAGRLSKAGGTVGINPPLIAHLR